MKPVDVELEVQVRPSFRKHVGCTGVGLMLVAVCVGAGHFYIAYLYTDHFNNMAREHVWPFFTLSVASLGLVGYHLLRWKAFAKEIGTPNDDAKPTLLGRVKRAKEKFDMNGDLFLWKLYALELAEAAMQTYNLIVVYACTLPVPVVCVLCAGLAADNVWCVRSIRTPNTPERRDQQVKVDLAVDILCSTFPLLFLWFAFRVPVSVPDMLLLTAWPTVSSLLKLDELLEENVQKRHATATLGLQRQSSLQQNRRRSSLFEKPTVIKMAEEQDRRVPIVVKRIVSGVLVLSALFFVAVGIVQASVRTTGCHPILWGKCEVQVPFCGSLFAPTCNCAVLTIEGHNMTKLPEEVKDMTALRAATVTKGPLQTLPGLSPFPVLAKLNVADNYLQNLPDDMGTSIVDLDASANRLKRLPNGMRNLMGLRRLIVPFNQLEDIGVVGRLRSLIFLWVQNNSIIEVPENTWASVTVLIANANRIMALPLVLEETKVRQIYLSMNNISSLPEWMGAEKHFRFLDVRHNRLASLPRSFERSSLTSLWVAGNPICGNGWINSADCPSTVRALAEEGGKGCSKQCSVLCLDVWKGDGECLQNCNVPACSFDGGDCTS